MDNKTKIKIGIGLLLGVILFFSFKKPKKNTSTIIIDDKISGIETSPQPFTTINSLEKYEGKGVYYGTVDGHYLGGITYVIEGGKKRPCSIASWNNYISNGGQTIPFGEADWKKIMELPDGEPFV